MKQIILNFFIAITFMSHICFGQVDSQYPYRAKRFEIAASFNESFAEYGYQTAIDLDENPEGRLVIRLCTKERLEVAIPTASINPVLLADYLTKNKLESPYVMANRIFVDRSEKCIGKKITSTASELWYETENKIVQDSKEKINICQISSKEIRSKQDDEKKILIGTYDHKKALSKFVDELKQNPQSTGVIVGNYIDYQSKSIKWKLGYAKRKLSKSGLDKTRYSIRLMRWNGNPDNYEPKYLRFWIIEIKDISSCSLDIKTPSAE